MKLGIASKYLKKGTRNDIGCLASYVEKLVTSDQNIEVYIIGEIGPIDKVKLNMGAYGSFKDWVRLSKAKPYTKSVGKLNLQIGGNELVANHFDSVTKYVDPFDKSNFLDINPSDKLYTVVSDENSLKNALKEGIIVVSRGFEDIVGSKFLITEENPESIISQRIKDMVDVEYDYVVNLQRSHALQFYGNRSYVSFRKLLYNGRS